MENTREWFISNRERLFAEIGVYECMNCESTKHLHLHHVVPLANGGTNRITNLRVLCNECHAKAHGDFKVIQTVHTLDGHELLTAESLSELRDHHGLSAKEIAELIGCSESAVYKRLSALGLTRASKETQEDLVIEFLKSMTHGQEITKKQVREKLGVKPDNFKKIMKGDRIKDVCKSLGIEISKFKFKKNGVLIVMLRQGSVNR